MFWLKVVNGHLSSHHRVQLSMGRAGCPLMHSRVLLDACPWASDVGRGGPPYAAHNPWTHVHQGAYELATSVRWVFKAPWGQKNSAPNVSTSADLWRPIP